MPFAAAKNLDEGMCLETFLTLKVERALIYLVGAWRPTVYII
jgi:hypothetical protein